MPAVRLAGVSNISKAQAAPYPTPDATMAPRPTAHLRTHCKETPAHHTRAAKTDMPAARPRHQAQNVHSPQPCLRVPCCAARPPLQAAARALH